MTAIGGSASVIQKIFIINKTRILLGLSLIFVWSIAHLIPRYKDTVKHLASSKYHDAVQHLPAVKVDWHPSYDPKKQFNSAKVAMIIEGRPLPNLVPLLLHMMSVVPPDWRFMFVGSNKSVISVSRSFATQYHEANGKLDLVILPQPWKLDSKESIFRLMTDMRFYDEVLPDVEWLLKFEADSILCANSGDSINNWLQYHWAGAPKSAEDNFSGNGGLSLRRLSAVKRILSFQSRYNDTEPEDQWFGRRMVLLPDAVVSNTAAEKQFAVEDIWHEKPMGFHVRNGGEDLADDVWKNPERRKQNFEYCPELSIIMPMKLEVERCEGDNKEGEIIGPANADDKKEQ